MKIVLISGMSGTGKTSIAKNLCERFPDKYNFIHSYTDRGLRESDEWGHTFVDSKYMDSILERSDIVAQTKIDNYRYCTLRCQFDEHKVNLYTVDIKGINDTIGAFPDAAFMTILVRRDEIEGDCLRLRRNVLTPIRDDVDFLIDNNGTIESAANLLNAFVNFDFFSEPSKQLDTLEEKIDYIDMQIRFLEETKESIYEQMWYQNLSLYKLMCQYVETQVNNEMDFKVNIKPDTSPEIFEGLLHYNVQASYDTGDLMWDEINRLVEKMSHYAWKFCKENDCLDIAYRLVISEYWNGQEEYQ